MNRRDFVIASGTSVLTGGIGISQIHRPAIGIDFRIETTKKEPKKVDSLLLDFDKLEITPRYLDESENITVQAELDVDNYQPETSDKLNFSVENGKTEQLSKEIDPVLVEGIDTDSSIYGTVTVSVVHPDIDDSYSRRFNVTDTSLSTLVDSYEDGNLSEYNIESDGSWSITSNEPIDGSNELTGNNGGSYQSTTVSRNTSTPEPGDTISVYVQPESESNNGVTNISYMFGGESAVPNIFGSALKIVTYHDEKGGWFLQELDSNGNVTNEVKASDTSKTIGQWYEFLITWDSNITDFTWDLYKTDGNGNRTDTVFTGVKLSGTVSSWGANSGFQVNSVTSSGGTVVGKFDYWRKDS